MARAALTQIAAHNGAAAAATQKNQCRRCDDGERRWRTPKVTSTRRGGEPASTRTDEPTAAVPSRSFPATSSVSAGSFTRKAPQRVICVFLEPDHVKVSSFPAPRDLRT